MGSGDGMASYHLLTIGNAIVDVVATVEDDLIEQLGLVRGTMNLVDAERSAQIHAAIGGEEGPAITASGGSAGNTIYGLAALGGRGAYIGKVRDDTLGQFFSDDMERLGVDFPTTPADAGPATARCMVLVTPDAHRTMCTYLGACVRLGPADIDPETVRAAEITYMEGYLYDPPEAQRAFVKAAEIAHQAGRRVSVTLSDPFCVDRHRDAFRQLVAGHVDILFANEEEILSLYQVDRFDDALQAVRGDCHIAALTRSERGSVIVSGEEVHVLDAEPVDQVLDTTGAGDLYASGFLYGITHGYGLADSGRIGGMAAAEVIRQIGPRPPATLSELVAARFQ